MSKALKRYAVVVSKKRRWPLRDRPIAEVHFYAYDEAEVKQRAVAFAQALADEMHVRKAAVDIQPTDE